MLWDYHVVLAVFEGAGAVVWDLDCALGAPLPAERWLDASLPAGMPAEVRPRFRVLDAREYVRVLSSDRSHMRTTDGGWLAPAPPWAPIGSGLPTLGRLVDLEDPFDGTVLDVAALRARWASTG